ncbi:hypothetical protein D3C77_318980 [compost metagenome]
MHGRLAAQVAQYPFDKAGCRQSPYPPAGVGDLEPGEFDWRVQGDENPQFAAQTVFDIFEDAVAKAVTGAISARARAGLRSGRPELTAVFVTQVYGFATGIAYRVVVPGREPELMGILAPRVGAASLRHDAAELRIGQHIDPWRRRWPAGDVGHDVLAAIGTETAIGVGEFQRRLALLFGRCFGWRTEGRGGFERRQ